MSPNVAEAMASEKDSMETPPSEEKAVNQPRELGGELVPVGEPVVFGPPVKDEAVLASLRPSFLPAEASGGDLSGVVAAVVAGGTGLLERAGMSLLGVAGAVTDKVIPMVMVAAENLHVIQMVFHGILMGVMGAVVLPACLMVDLVEVDLLEEDRLVVDLVMTLGSILEHCNRFLAVLLVINRCALLNFLIYKSLVREKWVP
eukprot:s1994_g7.t1